MARLLHQQKVDNDSLKAKIDSLSAQKASYTNQFEIERSKLLQELERGRDVIQELELKKNNQISELRNNHLVEVQGLKRQLGHVQTSSDH